MALSNIFNEPRREITESLVGVALLGEWFFADYKFGCWFSGHASNCNIEDAVGGMFLGAIATAGLALVLLLTHALGEITCDTLEGRGVRLRPQRGEE